MTRNQVVETLTEIMNQRPDIVKMNIGKDDKDYFPTKRGTLVVDDNMLEFYFAPYGYVAEGKCLSDVVFSVSLSSLTEIALGRHSYGYVLHVYTQDGDFFNSVL